MSNQQPAEQAMLRIDGHLALHHVWVTMQGEGPFAGSPAIFVRLSGCNLQCPACDTDYTSKRVWGSPDTILDLINATIPRTWNSRVMRHPLVVITGGEPFRQNIVPLCALLLGKDYFVQIETNGTRWLPEIEVLCNVYPNRFTIVCSPKTPKLHEDIHKYASCFKYILQAGHIDIDGLPLTTMGTGTSVARPTDWRKPVYVQALDENMLAGILIDRNELNRKATVESAMHHGYKLSIQTHKINNLE